MINARLATLLCLTIAGPVAAQDAVDEIREYTVEVIVFSYEENVSVGTERFLPDEPEPVSLMPDFFLNAVQPVPLPEPEPSPPENEAPVEDIAEIVETTETDYLLSPTELLELADVRTSLERRSTYRPLLHAAWTQQALPEERALVVDLDKLAEPPDALSGSFTLYLSRFLHLVVDLELDHGGEPGLPIEVEWPGQAGEPLSYRINEDRIFRSGETRYYDHPRFGVVAKVTRVEQPEPEEEDEGDALANQLVN
ncbi:MAG: CsiV family protein [Pseudomonadota bacterium]